MQEGQKNNSANLGTAAIIAAIFIPLAQILAPVISDTYNINYQTKENKEIEISKRKVEIMRLLFENYFGKSPEQQSATISSLTVIFPEELVKIQPLLVTRAENNNIRKQVTQALATTTQIEQSGVNIAVQNEKLGFLALLNGNLTEARTNFRMSYKAFPTYHNVDEIYNKLLTQNLVDDYNQSTPEQKKVIQKDILEKINSLYSWGVPTDIKKQIDIKLKL